MLKERIYIAGKVSGLNYNYAWHQFAAAEKHLTSQGRKTGKRQKVVNPMVICRKEWSWLRCMIVCLRYLIQCDTIYLLENWKYSRGAKIEYTIACLLRKNIIFQKY